MRPRGNFQPVFVCVALLCTVQVSIGQRFHFERYNLSTSPTSRSEACLVSVNGGALLFGGRRHKEVLSDTWLFTESEQRWVQVSTLRAPTPRYAALCATTSEGGKETHVYVVGGRNLSRVLDTSIAWTFDVQLQEWAPVMLLMAGNANRNTAMRTASRAAARASALGGPSSDTKALYMSHGYDAGGHRSDALEVKFVTPFVGIVKVLYPSVGLYAIGDPHPLRNAASTVTRANEIIAYGGCYFRGKCPSKDAWALDRFSKQWRFLLRGPVPVADAVMVNSLPSFKQAGMDHRQTTLIWGGNANSKQTIWTTDASAIYVSILDVRNKTWLTEEASGDPASKGSRSGASIVQVGTGSKENPFRYLIFGGEDLRNNNSPAEGTLVLLFNPRNKPRIVQHDELEFRSYLSIHGIFMGLAFGIFMPFGFFAARHFRFFSQNYRWFVAHYVVQWIAFATGWLGMIAILMSAVGARVDHPHAIIGVVVMTVMSGQIVFALPGIKPKPNAGSRRDAWGLLHKWAGRLLLVAGLVNIALGLQLIVAPSWVWICWIVYLGVVFGSSFAVECFLFLCNCKGQSEYINYDTSSATLQRLPATDPCVSSDGVSPKVHTNKTGVKYDLDWYP